MQGIKFFEPTLMRDTPDAVERDGMQYILNQVGAQLGQQQGVPLLDPSTCLTTVFFSLISSLNIGYNFSMCSPKNRPKNSEFLYL